MLGAVIPKDRFQVCLTLIIYHILNSVLKGQGEIYLNSMLLLVTQTPLFIF